jgi:phosphoglycolate phosphatase
MAPSTELYDGVKDLVHRLTSSNFVLGILSTKFRYRICQILERYELTDQFSVIVGGEDIEKSKPDPEGLHLILSKTSIKPEQAVLVGDSLTDAETALRGGIDFIAVLTGTTSADQFTDYSPKAVLGSVTGIEKYT